ncbi:MAG: macro domain-containing protein [Nitrososphaerota archaeon]
MHPIRLLVAESDITKMQVDTIVNSANAARIGRGGLNETIYRAAGPRLLRATQALRGQPVGTVKLTLGYQLPARHIIHVIVPDAEDDMAQQERLLAMCYRRCLSLASLRRFRTLVFPVLGSGERGFSFRRAATIALTEIQRHLESDTVLRHVVVTVYDSRGSDLSILSKELLGYYMEEGWELDGSIHLGSTWLNRRYGRVYWWKIASERASVGGVSNRS